MAMLLEPTRDAHLHAAIRKRRWEDMRCLNPNVEVEDLKDLSHELNALHARANIFINISNIFAVAAALMLDRAFETVGPLWFPDRADRAIFDFATFLVFFLMSMLTAAWAIVLLKRRHDLVASYADIPSYMFGVKPPATEVHKAVHVSQHASKRPSPPDVFPPVSGRQEHTRVPDSVAAPGSAFPARRGRSRGAPPRRSSRGFVY